MFRDNIVSDLLVWIDENIDNRLKIDDFVEKSGYSKWHVQRIFRETTGQPLAAYCRQKRLQAAATMLRTQPGPILAVALSHGFPSHETFHKAFKRQYGITPGQYRENHPLP
nr:helix-turn-helix domain-containing protein [Winslowiella toletana]